MEPFIAQIMQFGSNFAPRGWAFCDGQLLPISQNTALFSLIGTIYGGDGRTTFALPDMRGRAPIHPGNGPGLSPYRLGQRGGAEQVALNVLEIPSHSHSVIIPSSRADGDQASPEGNILAKSPSPGLPPEIQAPIYTAGTADSQMRAPTVGNSGGGRGHTNVQPFLCVNFIIALQGIFPSRN